jgi:flavin-dependent dehydrogenase
LDATGRSSTALRQEGAKRAVLDKLVAIYALAAVAANDTSDARTYVESTPDGWWYSALLPGARRIFAFQTDADLLRGQDWRNPQWLRQRLRQTKHVGLLLSTPRMRFIHPPKSTAAQSGRLEPAAGDGWMAAGDAAQSFDPLSGEGLFHALYSGHCASLALQNELAGQSGARQEYVALLAALWERFVIQRRIVYSSETRWPEEPFWRRRNLH